MAAVSLSRSPRRPGVFLSEEIFDPDVFFADVGRYCVPLRSGEDLVLLTVSDG